ncbi:hypothetical protein QQX98_004598 [Neonectria punicea]|uniref:C2H2-type domain-containing protein n=1 Tax=Neonectria punicea TaxID=979145 RepID=A0ABR1H8K7_9HYPO
MSQYPSFSTDELIISGPEVNLWAEDATLIGPEPTNNEPAAPETVTTNFDFPLAAPANTLPSVPFDSDFTQTPASPFQEHSAVVFGSGLQCRECGQDFKTKTALDRHGSCSHHPFACTCGTSFARSDILSRHLTTKNGEPQYRCPLPCKKKGQAVFYRLDHLKQHLVRYHKCDAEEVLRSYRPVQPQSDLTVFPVCYFEGCPISRDIRFHLQPQEVQEQTKPFANNTEYYKHMRTAHNWTEHPCSVPGCDRIGAKGYFREMDLVRHHRLKHSSASVQA